jgi:hypothetical protein
LEEERDWRKPGLHLAIWLFGTGLGILLAMPLSMLIGTTGVRRWLVLSWVLGVAATYAIVALVLKAPADRIRS